MRSFLGAFGGIILLAVVAIIANLIVDEPNKAEAQIGTARTPLVLEYFFSDTTTIASLANFVCRFPNKSAANRFHFATTGATSQSVTYSQITWDQAILKDTIRIRVYSRNCPGDSTEYLNRASQAGIFLPAFSSGIDSIRILNGSAATERFSVLGMR